MAKRKNKQARRKRTQRDATENAMIEAVAAMTEVLTCPVLIAADHAEFCANLAWDAEARARIAELAMDLHADLGGELVGELEEALADFIETMERHQRELAVLAERFALLEDHDVEHEHLDPQSIPITEVAECMFGPPTEAVEERP